MAVCRRLARLAARLQDPRGVAAFQRLCGVEGPAGWAGGREPVANGGSPPGGQRHPAGNGAVPGGAAPQQRWRRPRRNSLTEEDGCQEFNTRSRFLYYLFSLGTELGNELFYILFFPFCIWNLDAWLGRRLIIIWVWVMYVGQCTKDVIRWPRPASPPVVKLEVFYNSEYSMPSTHAMSGTAIPLALLLLSYGRWQYPLMFGLILAFCWCSLVCCSRIYMGMHSILDVIAGFLYAILILIVFHPVVDLIDNFNLTYKLLATSRTAFEMSAVEKIEEQFASLRIAKRSVLSEEPAYLLDVDVSGAAQSESSRFVAVSCSNKSVRVYNRETLSFLREYSSCPGTLNGVRFARACDSLVFSACTDGTVKCWDIRLATQKAAQVFSGYPSNVFISFDINCSDLIICAGTEKVEADTFLVFWDARGSTDCASTAREPLGVYSESHNDDVTKICFHPVKPSVVVSGSTDGLVNVFDINKDNEDDALISTCNSDSSVSFIGWSGKDCEQIYCTTHDEGFCWWDLAQLDTEEPIILLRVLDARDAVCIENGSLNYLVGGMYHEKADKLFLIGGTATGDVHLLSCSAAGLSLVGTLPGGHSATVRSFCWDPAEESLLTGGEDAQLLLWRPGAVERSLAKKTSMKIASSVQKRVRVHNSSLKSRKK